MSDSESSTETAVTTDSTESSTDSTEVSDVESSSDEIDEPVPSYECPILLEPCIDPVLLVDDKITYERAAIKKWMKSNRTTPMGTCLVTKRLISNLAIKHGITVCPFSKEEYRDPIIVEPDGMTYEHHDLVERIKQTLCKYQPIRLHTDSYRAIRCYSNIALWKDEFSASRKPFIMPETKVYPGYVHTPETMVMPFAPGSYVDTEPYSNERNETKEPTTNHVFHYITFKESGCMKYIKFNNCYFYGCVFTHCMCSLFKNCKFEKCLFVEISYLDQFQVRGSVFTDCLFRDSKNQRKDKGMDGVLDSLLWGATHTNCIAYPDSNNPELTEACDQQFKDRAALCQTMRRPVSVSASA